MSEKEWLDGPQFVRWLEDEFNFDRNGNGPVVERRIHSLMQGGSISVWSADRLLTAIGLHISLIPDELWLARRPYLPPGAKPKPRTYVPVERKEEAVKRYANEERTIRQLAEEFNVHDRTVRRWTREIQVG